MGGGGGGKAPSDDIDDDLPDVAPGWPLKYQFSTVAAVIFVVLFLLSALIHTYQAARTRTRWLIPLVIGAWLEAIGYIARGVAAAQYPKYNAWAVFVSFILTFVAPTFIAATLYMELGRIIRMCSAERFAIIKPTWMSKIFVTGDTITLLGQVLGGIFLGNPSSSESQKKLGKTIATAAFSVQVAFLALYIMIAIIFHQKYGAECLRNKGREQLPWSNHMKAMYFAVTMLMYRSMFHLVGFLGKFDFFTDREWPTYVLDSTPMFLAVAIFIFVHPSEVNALLGRRGLVCKRVFRFEKPAANTQYHDLYRAKARSASPGPTDTQPLVADGNGNNSNANFHGGEYHSQTQAMYTPAMPSNTANVAMKPYHSGPNYRYGDEA